MRGKIKVVLLISLFLIVGCDNATFTWNDTVVTVIDGDSLAHYSLKQERQQTRELGHVKCALIDMTGSESLVSYDNDLIIYFDTFGKPNYIENSKDVVAVKILEKYLLVVSQFEDYFVVSEYSKSDTEKGIENQVKFDGLYHSVNYINKQLLISYYSMSDKVSRIDRINDDLTRTKVAEKKGNYILYPIYYSNQEFAYSLMKNVERNRDSDSTKVEIKIIDSKGISYQHHFQESINKSVLIKDKLYIMSGIDDPCIYMFDMELETLELYSENVDVGAGLFNIKNNLVIINKKEIVVNNRKVKSLGETKIDTRYH